MAFIIPHKFRFLPSSLKNQAFNLLDVGAGSHSATKTTRLFPLVNYYGIDITKEYENDENDFKAMKGFFQMDLTLLQFDEIPDSFFDVIIMSHIIEHLHNGDDVIRGLVKKLKPGGKIYIEYPGEKSTRLPSMKRTLNFYDDPTHVRIYSVGEIGEILEKNGFKIKSKGTRRYWPYIVLLPITIITELVKYKFIPGGVFWDLMGFAEYLYAEKQ